MPYIDRPGAKIWWDVTGSGDPVLIIQGLGYPSDASWRVLPKLSERHTVLLLDNRGTGRSAVPSEAFSIQDMAHDAAAAIAAAGLGPAHVMGFSMGGLIAQELTLSHPKLVRTLTLGCTSPGGDAAILASPEVGKQFVEWEKMPPIEAAHRAAKVVYAESTPAALIEADIEVRMRYPTDRHGYICQLRAVAEYPGALDRLDQITQPILILQGGADRIVPRGNADTLAAALPHARTLVVEGAGHILMTDATATVLAAFEDFVDTARSPGSTG